MLNWGEIFISLCNFVANWLVLSASYLSSFHVYLNCEFIQFIILSVLCCNIKLLHFTLVRFCCKLWLVDGLVCGICVCIFLFWKWWDIIFQGRGVCNPREITVVIVLWWVIFYIWFISLLMVSSGDLLSSSSNFSFHWTVSPMILVTFGGKISTPWDFLQNSQTFWL